MLRVFQSIGLLAIFLIVCCAGLAYFLGANLKIERSIRIDAPLQNVEELAIQRRDLLIEDDASSNMLEDFALTQLIRNDSLVEFAIKNKEIFGFDDRLIIQKEEYHTLVNYSRKVTDRHSWINDFKILANYSSSIDAIDSYLEGLQQAMSMRSEDIEALYGFNIQSDSMPVRIALCIEGQGIPKRSSFVASTEEDIAKVKRQLLISDPIKEVVIIDRFFSRQNKVFYFAGVQMKADTVLPSAENIKVLKTGGYRTVSVRLIGKFGGANRAYHATTHFIQAHGLSVIDSPWEERIDASMSESGEAELHIFYPVR